MDLNASTDMLITASIIERVTMARIRRAASIPRIIERTFTARQCMTRAVVKHLADTSSDEPVARTGKEPTASHQGVARMTFPVPLGAHLVKSMLGS